MNKPKKKRPNTNLPKTIRIDAHVLRDVVAVQKWMTRQGCADASYSDAIREITKVACERDPEFASRLQNQGRFIDPKQTRLVFLPTEGNK